MGATIYVRWMCAFRSRWTPITQAIKYEMERSDEVACEYLTKRYSGKYHSYIRSNVGLLFDEKYIVKRYAYDCWSEYTGDKLEATSPNRWANHTEAWARANKGAHVVGLVVPEGITRLNDYEQKAVRCSAKRYALPVYRLTSTGLKREEL